MVHWLFRLERRMPEEPRPAAAFAWFSAMVASQSTTPDGPL